MNQSSNILKNRFSNNRDKVKNKSNLAEKENPSTLKDDFT